MTRSDLIDLVKTYFSHVDNKDLDGVLSTLTDDCRFSVETHGVALKGHAEIRGMFEQLWSRHAEVLHDRFSFVVDPDHDRISAQFRVVNTLHDGSLVYKSNCNFFAVRNGRFDTVAVYMTGENTLERKA